MRMGSTGNLFDFAQFFSFLMVWWERRESGLGQFIAKQTLRQFKRSDCEQRTQMLQHNPFQWLV